MNIKRVAVLGAGAVGSYVIWGLSNNKDITLGVIASGEKRTPQKTRHNDQWNPIHSRSLDTRRSKECGSSDRIAKVRKSKRRFR